MKGVEYFATLLKSGVLTEESNVMVNSQELLYHRISDAIDEVMHKLMSL